MIPLCDLQVSSTKWGSAGCFAERMECGRLAGAFDCRKHGKSESKLPALQTLRAVRMRLAYSEDTGLYL